MNWEKATTLNGLRQYRLFVDDRLVFTVDGAEGEWRGHNILTDEFSLADNLREYKERAEREIAAYRPREIDAEETWL